MIVTDEDFGLDGDEELYRAVLYVDNTMVSVEQVADIIHVILQYYPQSELQRAAYAGEEWL